MAWRLRRCWGSGERSRVETKACRLGCDVEQLCLDRRFGLPMIEPLLCGIVLGLIPVTLMGLFVAAWNQYRRGSLLDG
jgi:cytochrome b6-f complex subunit 5